MEPTKPHQTFPGEIKGPKGFDPMGANSRCPDLSGSDFTPEMLQNLKAWSDEDERLSKLSDIDLIKEVLNSDAGDSLAVTEMMSRLRPGWENEIISQNIEPTRSRGEDS